MLLGVPVSAGFADKASARLSRKLQDAGSDEAIQAALAAEPVLSTDETPVSVLTPDTDPDTGQVTPGAAQVMVVAGTPDGRLTRLRALTSRRAESITAILSFFCDRPTALSGGYGGTGGTPWVPYRLMTVPGGV